jgi:hypothetical protein
MPMLIQIATAPIVRAIVAGKAFTIIVVTGWANS